MNRKIEDIVKPLEIEMNKLGRGTTTLSNGRQLFYSRGNERTEKSLTFLNPDGSRGTWLNSEFYNQFKRTRISRLPVFMETLTINDRQEDKVLAKQVSIRSGEDSFEKIWLNFGKCGPNIHEYYQVQKQFRELQ